MKFLVIFVLHVVNLLLSYSLVLACRLGITMDDSMFYFLIGLVALINFGIALLMPGFKGFFEEAMNPKFKGGEKYEGSN